MIAPTQAMRVAVVSRTALPAPSVVFDAGVAAATARPAPAPRVALDAGVATVEARD
ncbi:MAG: hypothetical protein ACU0DT_11040 [Albimonas sp.]|uniref:hypothetical protein n=1 Tax=Albimonas sp. TaxID=1872425 RepID=UPI0040576333|tara:strand:+ start:237 stop:404 length:168 start_codon:yes stop_codon:yes gene_type:complete